MSADLACHIARPTQKSTNSGRGSKARRANHVSVFKVSAATQLMITTMKAHADNPAYVCRHFAIGIADRCSSRKFRISLVRMANSANMMEAGRKLSESRNLMENSDWTNRERNSSDNPQLMPAPSVIMTRERQTMLQKTRTTRAIGLYPLQATSCDNRASRVPYENSFSKASARNVVATLTAGVIFARIRSASAIACARCSVIELDSQATPRRG